MDNRQLGAHVLHLVIYPCLHTYVYTCAFVYVQDMRTWVCCLYIILMGSREPHYRYIATVPTSFFFYTMSGGLHGVT